MKWIFMQEEWCFLMCEKGANTAILGSTPMLRYSNRVCAWVCLSGCFSWPPSWISLILGLRDLNMTHNWMQRVQEPLFLFFFTNQFLVTEQEDWWTIEGRLVSSVHRHPKGGKKRGSRAHVANLHLELLIAYFWVLLRKFCTCLLPAPYGPLGFEIHVLSQSSITPTGCHGSWMLYSYDSKYPWFLSL